MIRVSKLQNASKAVAYIVALTDPTTAMELIRRKVADPEDHIEDLGRVSDELLAAMKLETGAFTRA